MGFALVQCFTFSTLIYFKARNEKSKDLKLHFKYVPQGHLTLMLEKNKGKQCTIHYPSAHKPLSKEPTTSILCCLTFQTLSTQLPSDSANRNLIFHVFWRQIFLPHSYQEGETQRSSDRVQSRDRRTGAHNFTCLPYNPHTSSYITFHI